MFLNWNDTATGMCSQVLNERLEFYRFDKLPDLVAAFHIEHVHRYLREKVIGLVFCEFLFLINFNLKF